VCGAAVAGADGGDDDEGCTPSAGEEAPLTGSVELADAGSAGAAVGPTSDGEAEVRSVVG
jgi:hypothetical protein